MFLDSKRLSMGPLESWAHGSLLNMLPCCYAIDCYMYLCLFWNGKFCSCTTNHGIKSTNNYLIVLRCILSVEFCYCYDLIILIINGYTVQETFLYQNYKIEYVLNFNIWSVWCTYTLMWRFYRKKINWKCTMDNLTIF